MLGSKSPQPSERTVTDPVNETPAKTASGRISLLPSAIYTCYLAGLLSLIHVIFILPPIVGVVLAYVGLRKAPEWVRTHHAYQIVTFWVGVVGTGIVMFVYIVSMSLGFLLFGLVLAWVLVRCFYGLGQLSRSEPIYDPSSFLMGWKRSV